MDIVLTTGQSAGGTDHHYLALTFHCINPFNE